MRSLWLMLGALFIGGCSGDSFVSKDGGEDAATDAPATPIEGGPGVDAGDAGDGGPDSSMPKPIHRLFVGNAGAGSQNGIVAWDDVDTIAQDRAPDVAMTDPATKGQILALELVGNRLMAFNDPTKKLVAIDGAGKITSGTAPAFTLGPGALVGGGSPGITRMIYSTPGDLLLTHDLADTRTQMFTAATSMSSSSTSKAKIGANVTYGCIARDAANDRLFVGNQSAQVVQYVNGVSGVTGAVTPMIDFAGTNYVAWAMAIDNVRLYVAAVIPSQNDQLAIQVYNLNGIHPGSQPDATITKNLPTGALPLDLVVANDTLLLSYWATPSKVLVYPGAKSLGSQAQGVPLTSDDLQANHMRFSEKTGRLYIAGKRNGAPGVFVYRDVANTPTLQATLTTGTDNPLRIALFEP